MKTITKLSVALVAVAALTIIPLRSAPGGGADTGWEHDSYVVDAVLPVPCLGEDVHFFGEVPYKRHTVTTASGGSSYKLQLLPVTPNSPQFYGIGVISGKVYQYNNGLAINESYHLAAGETHTLQDHEMFVADDGERFAITFQLTMTVAANGELIVDRNVLEYDCK